MWPAGAMGRENEGLLERGREKKDCQDRSSERKTATFMLEAM